VLRGVTLSVARGEVVALVGRSGSGKTTLLRCVNRMLAATSGDVRVDGRSVADWNPVDLRRHTGYVIQEVGLFPHWTVGTNVATVPRLLGWSDDRIAARVDELLEPPGAAGRVRDRWPDQLSGGQRRRVGLWRAGGRSGGADGQCSRRIDYASNSADSTPAGQLATHGAEITAVGPPRTGRRGSG
jgi:osmoprotectant transport system ATP-binding protein